MSKLKLKQEEKRTMYIDYIDSMYCAIDEKTGKSEFSCFFLGRYERVNKSVSKKWLYH